VKIKVLFMAFCARAAPCGEVKPMKPKRRDLPSLNAKHKKKKKRRQKEDETGKKEQKERKKGGELTWFS
jgi:hypothetical protein